MKVMHYKKEVSKRALNLRKKVLKKRNYCKIILLGKISINNI